MLMTFDKTVFIILGSAGKVASGLALELCALGHNVVNIPFSKSNDKFKIPSYLDGCLHSSALKKLLTNYDTCVFIDCYICLISSESDLILHLSIQNSIATLFPGSHYCCLSTFEPSIASYSRYRKSKYLLERMILKRHGSILRLGYFIFDHQLLCSEYFNICLCSDSRYLLSIPVTTSRHLALFIQNSFLQDDDPFQAGLLRCYTDVTLLRVQIFPTIKLVFSKCSFNIPCPLIQQSKSIYILLTLSIRLLDFFPFRISYSLSTLLQRLASLYEQQSIIVQYDPINLGSNADYI